MKTLKIVALFFAGMLLIASCEKDESLLPEPEYQNANEGTDDPDLISTIPPESISLDNITITKIPAAPNPMYGWDPSFPNYKPHNKGSRPDIFAVVYYYPRSSVMDTVGGTQVAYNASNETELEYDIPIVFYFPTHRYLIEVYDRDEGGEELMGKISFYPHTRGNGYPDKMYLNDGSGLGVELNFGYNF